MLIVGSEDLPEKVRFRFADGLNHVLAIIAIVEETPTFPRAAHLLQRSVLTHQ
jgi:hypothetical protein